VRSRRLEGQRVLGKLFWSQLEVAPNLVGGAALMRGDAFDELPGVSTWSVVRGEHPNLRLGVVGLACDPAEVSEQQFCGPDRVMARRMSDDKGEVRLAKDGHFACT
jgi:hypothetical protein